MTDREYLVELRRGIGIIIRATVRRYTLSYADFLPRDERPTVRVVEVVAAAPVYTASVPGVRVEYDRD